MLEQKIDDLIAAIKTHTEALLGMKSGATTTTKAADKATTTKAGKPEKAAPTSKHSRDDVMALAQEAAQKLGGPKAKSIIADVGGAAKLAEVADSKLDALFAAFTAALVPADEVEEEEEEL